jgi:hypothetical protein
MAKQNSNWIWLDYPQHQLNLETDRQNNRFERAAAVAVILFQTYQQWPALSSEALYAIITNNMKHNKIKVGK